MIRNGPGRILSVVVVCAVLLATGALNVCNLTEAYGSGAPYYSRSINMDKWTDPLPILGALDAAVLFAVVLWALWWRRTGART
ncbi:hypothetical protein SAMN02787142_1854 [Burkholderia sp. WP9]|jgi:hypothetical protein|nr:hypothetical protein SAMN02787142_1854 [Burkholderia sp. WP9]